MAIEVELSSPTIFEIGHFGVTNTLLTSVCLSLFLIAISFLGVRRLQAVPKGVQFWLEVIFEGAEHFMESIIGDPKLTRRVFPFLMTLFLLLVTSNLFGSVPVLGLIKFHEHTLFRAPSTDLNFVLSLNLLGFLAMQMIAIGTGGPLLFMKKYLNFSSPINFLLGLMEVSGDLARILSLTFRLFGNLLADEVLTAVLMTMAPFIAPVPFGMLSLGIAVIQASVLTILTLIFFRLSVIDPSAPSH